MRVLEKQASSNRLWRQITPDTEDMNSICELALKRLRADILSAQLPPGAKLIIKDLTESYQIGVSPLRDALAQLVGAGLVVRESQRGFQVAPVSRKDLRDVAKARKLIELAAFELSMQHIDEAWEKRVRATITAFYKASEGIGDNRPISADWEERHRAFHFALLSGCDSPTLFDLCSHLNDRFDRYRRLALPTRSFLGAVDQDHEVIFEAALAGRKSEAIALLGQHIDDTLAIIEEFFCEAQRFNPGSDSA
jgi:DNA-binding GntR family transcriptional regulator